MADWAKTVNQVIDNGFGGSRGGNAIIGAIPHHVAGTNGRDYVAYANSRNSHPNYHIGRDGSVTGIVHPDRAASSTGAGMDRSTIAFEMDNSFAGGDWPVSDATLEALIETILDHYRQSPRYGRGFAVNQPGVTQGEFFIGWHSQYRQTECPGPYVRGRIPWIVAELNRRANITTLTEEEMALGRIVRIAGNGTRCYLLHSNGILDCDTDQKLAIAKTIVDFKDGDGIPVISLGQYNEWGNHVSWGNPAGVFKVLDRHEATLKAIAAKLGVDEK